jgi:hypothetical protein
MTLIQDIPQPTGYSPEVLAAIQEAFDAVWTTLYAHMPEGGGDITQLKTRGTPRVLAPGSRANPRATTARK